MQSSLAATQHCDPLNTERERNFRGYFRSISD
jgi:hypothetical protein